VPTLTSAATILRTIRYRNALAEIITVNSKSFSPYCSAIPRKQKHIKVEIMYRNIHRTEIYITRSENESIASREVILISKILRIEVSA